MNENEVVRNTWIELEPELLEQGVELVEVEYIRDGSNIILRLYIDCEGGITLDKCAEVSQFLSPILDESDFIDGHYMLEVSSPGIDRPVRKPVDFKRFIGEKIKVVAHTAVLGRARFKGILTDFEDGLITIECDGEPYDIHVENLKKANLDR